MNMLQHNTALWQMLVYAPCLDRDEMSTSCLSHYEMCTCRTLRAESSYKNVKRFTQNAVSLMHILATDLQSIIIDVS